ncbi:hypothetical protein D8674_028557 [Pyrus ussuriensis x Pyrus communis]|uniref:Uncharacterized protein n=1 Tax=Pyrus ussuriensis x Pyrus communis TaxID=2448454 RepID=A0A5N5I3X0_9ROSA|nr:hypothetical protein D8674_028557 [Pyrus ussuriensis x Pyrus communis]
MTINTEDISELFRDLEVEAGPKVETRAHRRARATIMESSDSRLEERPQAQLALPGLRTSQASKSSSALPIDVGKKKQKTATKEYQKEENHKEDLRS